MKLPYIGPPPKPPSLEQGFVDAVAAIVAALTAQHASLMAAQAGTTPREEVNKVAELAIAQHALPSDAPIDARRRAAKAIAQINAILGRISFEKPDGMN